MSKWQPYNPSCKEDYLYEASYAIWCGQQPYARRLLYLLAKHIDTPDKDLDHREFLP